TTTCALDHGAFKPCAGSFTASGVADGPHLIEIKASDGLHETLINKAWTIDTIAPTITFEPIPSPLNKDSVKFAWRVSERSTLTCSLDGAAAVPCTSGFVAEHLLDGPHALKVTASDGLNTGEATQSFVVDAHPIGTAISIQG